MNNVKKQIENCVERTNELVAQNPDINSIWWYIENVPYNELKELETLSNKAEEAYGKLMLNVSKGNAIIFAYTKPMKIKTIIKVEEYEEAVNGTV